MIVHRIPKKSHKDSNASEMTATSTVAIPRMKKPPACIETGGFPVPCYGVVSPV
jgi:hypothetical protein